ncbi:Slc9a8 [Symbiodinium natans]|uniref:Slc9a8 protein n=1 Tax=Symbiodinium natans TaxID=878477 RepID=A0A812U246_9DINO|nr:Slc9a8 [Symbiodinium natans]
MEEPPVVVGAVDMEMAPEQQTMTGMGFLQSLLEPHSALIVKQTMRGCFQECLGCDAKSEYKIAPLDPGEIRGMDASETALGAPEIMYAIEHSSCCCRLCNPAGRGFEMHVSQGGEAGGPPVVNYVKPLTFPAVCHIQTEKFGSYDCPCCCCLPNMQPKLPDGSSLGSESRYYCDVCLYVPKFKYKEDDQLVYIIHPETCLGGACVACNICSGKGIAYMPFYFHDPETGDVIGEYDNPYTPQVRKVWAGWKKECCSTADTFTVVFPKDATVKRKAGLLGMTFLIDFTIFEGHQQSATYLDPRAEQLLSPCRVDGEGKWEESTDRCKKRAPFSSETLTQDYLLVLVTGFQEVLQRSCPFAAALTQLLPYTMENLDLKIQVLVGHEMVPLARAMSYAGAGWSNLLASEWPIFGILNRIREMRVKSETSSAYYKSLGQSTTPSPVMALAQLNASSCMMRATARLHLALLADFAPSFDQSPAAQLVDDAEAQAVQCLRKLQPRLQESAAQHRVLCLLLCATAPIRSFAEERPKLWDTLHLIDWCALRGLKGPCQNLAEEEGNMAVQAMLPISVAFVLCLMLSSSMESFNITWLPESGVVILIGLGLGAIFMVHFGEAGFGTGSVIPVVGPPAVKYAFLPIIIFESGWTLRWKDFASQLGYILVFAILGSVISMVVVAELILATSDYHSIQNRRTAFAYGSLIAATDPVATLATYASLKVEPVLNVMVFGESMINDAVAIVIFEILNSNKIMGNPCHPVTQQSISLAVTVGIFQKLAISISLGLASAMVLILGLRFASLKHSQLMEILYIMVSAYVIYAVAEKLHSSGIIATLFGSMLMGIYAKPHLSDEGNLLATFFVKGMATLADTFTFLIVGVGAVAVTQERSSFKFSLWVMLFCIVGRMAAVIPCGGIVNAAKTAIGRHNKAPRQDWFLLSWQHLFMMWHAGLRGAIALVLCWELGDWVDELEGPGTKEILITSTLVVICVFLLAFGGTTQGMLRCLKIRMGEDMPENLLAGNTMLSCARKCGHAIDGRLLWPCLVGGPNTKDATLEDLAGSALQEILQETGLSHRNQAFFRRRSSTFRICTDGVGDSELSTSSTEEETL